MKLFLYDKFLDAFSKLPKAIQKKTTEFLKKFRENPNASSINFEKIHSFADQNLRTVRIDLAYRAIIYVSEDSSVYHLLWVDHHDEAVQWANNKKFNWNRETQSYELYDFISEIKVDESIKIEKSNLIFKEIETEKLLRIGVPDDLIDIIKELQNFDDLEKLEKRLPEIAFENLFAIYDGLSIDVIIERVNDGKVESSNKAEQELSPNNKRNFHLITNDKELDEILSSDFDKWRIFLHPTQYAIAYKDYNGTIKVSGSAGTGKTIAAIHRAKFLCEKLSFSDKPILFTTFTKSLVKNIESIFKSMNFDFKKITIKNFHSFLCDYAMKNNLIPNNTKILDELSNVEEQLWNEVIDSNMSKFGLEFLKEEYNNIIIFHNLTDLNSYLSTPRRGRSIKLNRMDKINIWHLCTDFKKLKNGNNYFYFNEITNIVYNEVENNPELAPFSYIICDELQDFSNIELKLLRKLVPEKPNDISLFGDPLQNIYNKKIVFSELNINVRGNRSKRLLLNYRTTEEIRKCAIEVIKGEIYNDFDGSNELKSGYLSLYHGKSPNYSIFDSFDDELKSILELIKEYTTSDKETTVKYQDICVASRKHDTLREIVSCLHSNKIPYFDLKNSKGNSENGVRIATLHNLKGLEYRIVIICGINNNNFPYYPKTYQFMSDLKKSELIKSEKSLLYVAMTRARDILVFTGSGEKNNFLNLIIENDINQI